jgi:hypothetical protein
MRDGNRKPSGQSDRLCNDWLEFTILCVAGIGIGGGLFALLYLAHKAGLV